MALTTSEITSIRTRFQHAARPLVFYDDDADGLSSFLLLRHFNTNAIGVRVARGPELTLDFVRKVEENIPDLIVIVDKPLVDKAFFSKVKTPTIWIDHHGLEEQKPHTWKIKHLNYYNPQLHNKRDTKPVSYWAWKITQGPLWIAAIGTLADWDSSLLSRFRKEYPKLAPKKNDVAEGLYNSELGTLARMFNFLLKGASQQVSKNVNTLTHITEPHELLSKTSAKGRYLHKQFSPILQEYELQRSEAMQTRVVRGVYIHVFSHVKISLVAEVANEMLLRKKASIVLVGRRDGGRVKFSMRSHKKDLRPVLKAALVGIDGYGGGHKEACGGSVVESDWEQFVEQLQTV